MKPKKHVFLKEILFILILKVVLLYTLWWVCFSHPIKKPDKDKFANTIFGLGEVSRDK